MLDATGLGDELQWTGVTEPRHEVQVRIGDRLLGVGTGDPVTGAVTVTGTLEEGDIRDGTVTLLVQDGPRTQATLASGIDGRVQDPAAYDVAISHITDTQYLTESYPEVYAQLVSWIADNAGDRKIAFATHTGDLIQNWVDPDQSLDRAEREFERASAIQGILDDAGVPNSVLPGNHDNKRGVDDTLFNRYFPPSRYDENDWYGGSIAPDDNSANFSIFEQAGARFLMLSLPYAYGDREIEWAIQGHRGAPRVQRRRLHARARDAHDDRGRRRPLRELALGVARRRTVGPGDRPEPQRRAGAVGALPRARAAHHRERRRHRGSHRGRAAGRLPGVPHAHRRAGDRVPTAAAARPRVGAGWRSTRSRCGSMPTASYTVRLPAVRARQRATQLDSRRTCDRGASSRPGLQNRYDTGDDEFQVQVAFQYRKSVATTGVAAG